MEYQLSKASTVSIITAFTCHQLSIDIFFSFLPWNDIKIQYAGIWRFLIKNPTFHVDDTVFQKKKHFGGGGGFSLEAIHQSSKSSFWDLFVKTTKEKLITPLELPHKCVAWALLHFTEKTSQDATNLSWSMYCAFWICSCEPVMLMMRSLDPGSASSITIWAPERRRISVMRAPPLPMIAPAIWES